MNMSKIMHRQGDLLFIYLEEGTKMDYVKTKRRESKVILGSSVTGHDHALTEGEVYETDNPGRFYLKVLEKGAQVVHPEHASIPLSYGIWEVRRQREVNGFVQD